MNRSIYLVNPSTASLNYHGGDVYHSLGLPSTALVGDLATTTVAAMIPPDFDVRICDESISPANLTCAADVVGITGKSTQVTRMLELARMFRQRGKVVIIGGPFASLCPDVVRPHCDVLVRGELESISSQLFSDLGRGRWDKEYVGTQTDLGQSPLPRWDLYANDRALEGCVQTSRGCPFECEFCDVIEYVGRTQRHKSVHQILAELDVLYGLNYRGVFLADDNFTVHRQRSRELLAALGDWNSDRPDGRVIFSTQVSIDTAEHDDILALCQEAGVKQVFIGLETPNEESLRETKKRQNLGINLVDRVQRFIARDIVVEGGMMLGFDADGPDIFERQYEFAMATPVPIFTVGALVAPGATPLYLRMDRANRLIPGRGLGADMSPMDTNIVPKQMTREHLITGLRWLCNRLYDPPKFEARVLDLIARLGAEPDDTTCAHSAAKRMARQVDVDVSKIVRSLARLGPREAQMLSTVMAAANEKPATRWQVMSVLFRYRQIRDMYDRNCVWDPTLALSGAPDPL